MSDEPIDINKAREKKPEQTETDSFAETMRKNKENQERLKRERAKHNKKTVRDYRLK